jgi:hypothetical protein
VSGRQIELEPDDTERLKEGGTERKMAAGGDGGGSPRAVHAFVTKGIAGMRTPRTIGLLFLLGTLLAAGTAQADPILSDRIIIHDAAGKKILDVTRNESTPNLPELAISSGNLFVPHSDLNVDAGLILTDANNPDLVSDWIRVRVHSGKKKDRLVIVFKSNPDEKSLKLPGDFPKGAPRMAETGQLQDVTADLFPKWAAANQAAPFTVEVQSDLDNKPDKAPEPASLTLLGTGALIAAAWRLRRKVSG